MGSNISLELFFGTSAVLGGILFVIRMVLFFIGSEMHDLDAGHLDAHLDGSAGSSNSSFQFISLQGIAGFFMMFGLVGLALLSGGSQTWVALSGSTAAGLVTLWIVGKLFQVMSSLQSDGTMHIENAIGQEGTVYLSIPTEGSGQVRVAVQGGLKVFDAVSVNHERILTGERIRVVNIVSGNVLVVEKLTASNLL